MKFLLAISALMATIVAMATDNAVTHTLHLSLSPNATDVLTANGIWTPNLTAFAQGDPNTAGIDFVAEGDKLVASGIDISDLVHISITSDVVAKHSCDQCDTCLKAVAACGLLWFLSVVPFAVASPGQPSPRLFDSSCRTLVCRCAS